jgi:hypothetical protein
MASFQVFSSLTISDEDFWDPGDFALQSFLLGTDSWFSEHASGRQPACGGFV